ncbi:MAG: SDR family NAD(P)-dependent oxidoreductase, partial [Opitutaceae bacterium]
MFSLTGKSAIVTGGSSGIGLAIARCFSDAGASVLVADRNPAPEEFDYCEADVSCEDDVAAMFDIAQKHFGRVDILVNNAGIQPLGVGFERMTGPLLERTFAVNVFGVVFGLKQAARALADGGRVINMASFVGMIGTPGATAYGASKAAVIHLTRLGAIELAPRR